MIKQNFYSNLAPHLLFGLFKMLIVIGVVFCLGLSLSAEALANTEGKQLQKRTIIRGSGLDVPRFVTLKREMTNMRVGPGREYPLDWVYVQKNLPLKVISEFDVWRKVVDHEGVTGWIHSSLLSLKRFGLITKQETALYSSPDAKSAIRAIADKNVVMEIQYCQKQWCRLSNDKTKGWVERQYIWGILPDEVLK